MAIEGNMDYASARIHARVGLLPDEATWRRIESSRDLAHYLNAARASSLADWVATIDLSQDAHAIERALRGEWSRHVREVARWHPRAWQAWIMWIAWLPALSLFKQLARTDPAPAWLLADPLFSPVVAGSLGERAAALTRMGLAPIAAALFQHTSIAAAWATHWHALLPQVDSDSKQLHNALIRTLRRHEREMLESTESGDIPRANLAERLLRLFRNGGDTVVASVCYLGLLALHLERLRGGLVRRKLFALDGGATH
jgi:hypothetical protein